MPLDAGESEAPVDRSAFIGAVEAGAEEARRGDLHPHDEALEILDSFGE